MPFFCVPPGAVELGRGFGPEAQWQPLQKQSQASHGAGKDCASEGCILPLCD